MTPSNRRASRGLEAVGLGCRMKELSLRIEAVPVPPRGVASKVECAHSQTQVTRARPAEPSRLRAASSVVMIAVPGRRASKTHVTDPDAHEVWRQHARAARTGARTKSTEHRSRDVPAARAPPNYESRVPRSHTGQHCRVVVSGDPGGRANHRSLLNSPPGRSKTGSDPGPRRRRATMEVEILQAADLLLS